MGKKVKAAKKGGKRSRSQGSKQTSVSKESMAVLTVRIFLPSNAEFPWSHGQNTQEVEWRKVRDINQDIPSPAMGETAALYPQEDQSLWIAILEMLAEH